MVGFFDHKTFHIADDYRQGPGFFSLAGVVDTREGEIGGAT